MKSIRRVSVFLLCIFLAGCVSVKAPEKVQFKFGADDDNDRPARKSLRQDHWADHGPKERHDNPPRRDTRPHRKRKSKWDIPADIASMIVGEGVERHIFYAYDVLTIPNREVELVARIKSYARDVDVEGITLSFHRMRDGKRIGRAKTDADGYASIHYNAGTPGTYRFFVKMARLGREHNPALRDLPPALLLVAVRQRQTRFVVVDLDHTLVESSFFRVMLWDGGKPMRGSQRVMQRIAETYEIIYLTHRPNDLTRTSRLWLEDKGYPDGVILLSTARGMLGDPGRFKSKRLKKIRRSFPRLVYGIGDKESDIEAYRDNGMTAIWIPHFKNTPKDVRKLARQMRGWRDPNVIVVETWWQVKQVIFGNYRQTTSQFADILDARAKELREEEDEDD